jgi:hypothetical protein
MNVGELQELLEDTNPEAEVRLATQPSWPLAFSVLGIAKQADIDVTSAWNDVDRGSGRDYVDEDAIKEHAENVVWIVEGGHPSQDSSYAPCGAWDAAQR